MSQRGCFYDRETLGWKRIIGLILTIPQIFVGIVNFLQSLEYIRKMLPPFSLSLAEILSWFSLPALVAGILLIADSLWPGFLVGLKMRIKGIDFEAEIVEKTAFHLEENIRFKARFRGTLENGAFTVKVTSPVGTTIPDTKLDYVFWPCPDTVMHLSSGDVGRLKGTRLHEYRWKAKILEDYPTGEYKASIRVYNDLGGKNASLLREIEKTFVVSEEEPFTTSGLTSFSIHRWPYRKA